MREHGPLASIDYENDFWPEYLEKYIFYGLRPVKIDKSYGSPLNRFFKEEEFKIIIQRVEAHGIGVLGLHSLAHNYCDMELFEWHNHEMTNSEWLHYAFKKMRIQGHELVYMAVMHIFDDWAERN